MGRKSISNAILFFILGQLGLFGLCFFYIRFILMCAFSGYR